MNKTIKKNKYNKIKRRKKNTKKKYKGAGRKPLSSGNKQGNLQQNERLRKISEHQAKHQRIVKNQAVAKIQNAYRKQRNKGIQAAQGAIDAEKRRISAIDTPPPNSTITKSRISKLESFEIEQPKVEPQSSKRKTLISESSSDAVKFKDKVPSTSNLTASEKDSEFPSQFDDKTETVSPFKKFKKGVGNRLGTLKQKLTPDPKTRTVKNRQSIEAKVHDDSAGVELEDLARAPSSDPELNQENLIPEQQNISANPNEQIHSV